MIGGILVGIGVTALIFFVVWLLKNGGKPSPVVYVLLAVSLLILCVEGIWMVKTIQANRTINRIETVELVGNENPVDKTMAESSGAVRQKVMVTVTKARNRSIWAFVITAIVLGGLMCAVFPDTSRRRGTTTRSGSFRGPRRASKGRGTSRSYR